MGLAWQQGPLGAAVGHFLTPQPMPERLLYAEPLRRRMRVRFGDQYIADSEDVVLLHEPGRYPVAYFPRGDVQPGVLIAEERVTQHRDLGETHWFTVGIDGREANHAAWEYCGLPAHATVLDGRVEFAWRAMDAFYEEDERIVGHAADFYHRIDIRSTSRHLVVRDGVRVIADTHRPVALYESGSRPVGMCCATMWTNRRCSPSTGRPSVRTRVWPVTTRSANTSEPHGPTPTHKLKWRG